MSNPNKMNATQKRRFEESMKRKALNEQHAMSAASALSMPVAANSLGQNWDDDDDVASASSAMLCVTNETAAVNRIKDDVIRQLQVENDDLKKSCSDQQMQIRSLQENFANARQRSDDSHNESMRAMWIELRSNGKELAKFRAMEAGYKKYEAHMIEYCSTFDDQQKTLEDEKNIMLQKLVAATKFEVEARELRLKIADLEGRLAALGQRTQSSMLSMKIEHVDEVMKEDDDTDDYDIQLEEESDVQLYEQTEEDVRMLMTEDGSYVYTFEMPRIPKNLNISEYIVQAAAMFEREILKSELYKGVLENEIKLQAPFDEGYNASNNLDCPRQCRLFLDHCIAKLQHRITYVRLCRGRQCYKRKINCDDVEKLKDLKRVIYVKPNEMSELGRIIERAFSGPSDTLYPIFVRYRLLISYCEQIVQKKNGDIDLVNSEGEDVSKDLVGNDLGGLSRIALDQYFAQIFNEPRLLYFDNENNCISVLRSKLFDQDAEKVLFFPSSTNNKLVIKTLVSLEASSSPTPNYRDVYASYRESASNKFFSNAILELGEPLFPWSEITLELSYSNREFEALRGSGSKLSIEIAEKVGGQDPWELADSYRALGRILNQMIRDNHTWSRTNVSPLLMVILAMPSNYSIKLQGGLTCEAGYWKIYIESKSVSAFLLSQDLNTGQLFDLISWGDSENDCRVRVLRGFVGQVDNDFLRGLLCLHIENLLFNRIGAFEAIMEGFKEVDLNPVIERCFRVEAQNGRSGYLLPFIWAFSGIDNYSLSDVKKRFIYNVSDLQTTRGDGEERDKLKSRRQIESDENLSYALDRVEIFEDSITEAYMRNLKSKLSADEERECDCSFAKLFVSFVTGSSVLVLDSPAHQIKIDWSLKSDCIFFAHTCFRLVRVNTDDKQRLATRIAQIMKDEASRGNLGFTEID